MTSLLKSKFDRFWLDKIKTPKIGTDGLDHNKLRTYKNLKASFTREPYLDLIRNRNQRSFITMLCVSSHNLAIASHLPPTHPQHVHHHGVQHHVGPQQLHNLTVSSTFCWTAKYLKLKETASLERCHQLNQILNFEQRKKSLLNFYAQQMYKWLNCLTN